MEFIVQEQKYVMSFYNNNDHQKFIMNMGRNNNNDHVVVDDNNNNKNEEEDNQYVSEESSSSSSFDDHQDSSKESSSSSLDLLDDASSSPSFSSSPNGPLFGLSNLIHQLPIKRGLSKYYNGKSQSFTSLARVTSLEDLAKKETPYQKRLKSSMSYGGGLNIKSFTNPKHRISKHNNNNNNNKASFSNLSRKNSFVSTLPPLHHVQPTF